MTAPNFLDGLFSGAGSNLRVPTVSQVRNIARVDATGINIEYITPANARKQLVGAVFFPEDYGALGDGVTDDTVAIRAAITAANGLDYRAGTVQLGAATYVFTDTLLLDNNGVSLVGAGKAQTQLLYKPPTLSAAISAIEVRMNGYGGGGSGYASSPGSNRLQDFSLTLQSAWSGIGIYLRGVIRGSYSELWVRNFAGASGKGIVTETYGLNIVQDLYFENCEASYCNTNWEVMGNNVVYVNTMSNGAATVGVRVREGNAHAFFGGVIQSCGTAGIEIRPTADGVVNGLTISGIHFESNGAAGVGASIYKDTTASRTAVGVDITGCFFTHALATPKGIDLFGITDLRIGAIRWLMGVSTICLKLRGVGNAQIMSGLLLAQVDLDNTSGVTFFGGYPNAFTKHMGAIAINRPFQAGAGVGLHVGYGKAVFDEALYFAADGSGNPTGPFLSAGSGTPEGVLTAPVGSTYLRTNGGAGTSFYVKESGVGNTGWVGK